MKRRRIPLDTMGDLKTGRFSGKLLGKPIHNQGGACGERNDPLEKFLLRNVGVPNSHEIDFYIEREG